MKTEIEAKLKVDSLQDIAQRLKILGAQNKGDFIQRDTYFDADEDTLIKSDRGLRLRQQKSGGTEKVFLTYKGPKQKTKFKSRTEIEVAVSDFATMQELLKALGFKTKITFEKKRCLWLLDNCQICLDELPILGCFIETEGLDEQTIANLLEKLELSGLDHIDKTYSKLMADILSESPIGKNQILFETNTA